MRTRTIQVFAVFAALLLVTAMPASAADANLEVATNHDTSAELQNGTLNNAVVERSGEAGQVSHETYRSSAVARWAMDSGSGSTAYDHVGAANDGSISSANWTSGVSGTALYFNGSTQAVVGDNFDPGTGAITVSTWFTYDGGSYRAIFGKKNNFGGTAGYSLWTDGSKLIASVSDGSVDIDLSGPTLSQNKWYHATLAINPSTDEVRLYVNGELVNQSSKSLGGISNSLDFVISGRTTGEAEWSGKVDDTRVYDGEMLTPGQALRLEKYPNAKLSAQATERFAMDAGQGGTAHGDEGGTANVSAAKWANGVAGSSVSFTNDTASTSGTASLSGYSGFTMTSSFYSLQNQSDSFGVPVRKSLGTWRWATFDHGEVRFYWSDTSGTEHVIGASIPNGEWVNVAARYNPDTGKMLLYVNGSVAATKTLSTGLTMADDSSTVEMGLNDYVGRIDEVRTYNLVLSNSTVSEIHQHPAAATPETSSYTVVHNVSNSQKGWAHLDLQNASATVTWEGYDGNSWVTLNQSTYTTSGNVTQTWSTFEGDKVRVTVDYSVSHPDHMARLQDTGTLFQARDPTVDNSSASPQNETVTTTSDVTLKIPVNDSDFGTPQGDSAEVEFWLQRPTEDTYKKVATKTITSNQTVKTTVNVNGGKAKWYANVTDSYDSEYPDVQSEKFKFGVPANITIRNATNASQILKDNITIHAILYSSNGKTVIEREVTDGNVSLAGVPVGIPIVLKFTADGYYSRTFYVESIFEQDNAYLLNRSVASRSIEYQIDDRTGSFRTDDTTIRIQRAVDINDDGTLKWQTVAGDYFDASGNFYFNGEYETRYRIIVENSRGERRNLGPYTVTESEVEVLTIGKVDWPVIQGNATVYRANVTSNPVIVEKGPAIAVKYADSADKSSNLKLTVYERGNESNVLYQESPTGTYGKYYTEINVTKAQAEETWVAELKYDYNGSTVTQKRVVGTKTLNLPMDIRWISGAIMVFIPMLMSLYGPRTMQWGLVVTMVFVGVTMMFQILIIPIPAFAVGMMITAAGLLRTEAQAI